MQEFAERKRAAFRGSAHPFKVRKVDKMASRQSSSKLSTLASRVLSGAKTPTKTDAKRLAASVLSQDEKKGQR